MRVSELRDLAWGDVDAAGSRFRIRGGKTRAARRWVAVPAWVMVEVLDTCPPDDRAPTRRVFPGATRQTIGMAMRNACSSAGLPHYHPHDLRHRYASLKIREGVPIPSWPRSSVTRRNRKRWIPTLTYFSMGDATLPSRRSFSQVRRPPARS
jgi:integrase